MLVYVADYGSHQDLPCPSLAHTDLEVENATNLGLEANFHDGWSKEDRRTVANVLREHWAETLEKDRGTARVKLLRDSMVSNMTAIHSEYLCLLVL